MQRFTAIFLLSLAAMPGTASAQFGGARLDKCPTTLDSCKTCSCETVQNCTDPKNCKSEKICYVTTKKDCK